MLLKIGVLAKKSGVSIRTLRYYEEIELLIPSEILESGYRLYSEDDALRLQQILFYKALDYNLNEIKIILDKSDFDLVKSLEIQKVNLLKKQETFKNILVTLEKTILKLNKGISMKIEELYEGFPESKDFREEAIARWGDKVYQSENNLIKMGKTDFEELNQEFKELWQELAESIKLAADSNEVQILINKHFHLISLFWGVEIEDISKEQYLGLADLYIEDSRFTTINGIEYPEMGNFLKEAMNYYVENNL